MRAEQLAAVPKVFSEISRRRPDGRGFAAGGREIMQERRVYRAIGD